MELKHIKYLLENGVHIVLIVPYGIETFYVSKDGFLDLVLIVPYGIETLNF